MRKQIAAGLAVITAGLAVLAGTTGSAGAEDKTNIAPPKHLYGHDLRVRKGGEPHFGPDTPRVGVEFFLDEPTKTTIAISDKGAIAVTPAGVPGTDMACKWLTAHDLACRKAGEPEFTQKTKKWGVELFRDISSNRLLYVCESGSIILAQVPGELVTDKGPRWHHALEPKVRAPEQEKFDNAKKYGMEVFKDENTGGLIYVTEQGGITAAAAPGAFPDPKKIAPPKTQYGLILKVRGADEPNFTEKTKRIALEVFEDPNSNTLFYLTEQGFVAAVRMPAQFVPNAKSVTWKSAMALRARKAGEKEFEQAKKYGIEVFEDNRTGNLIFISETGSIAVLPKQ